MSNDSLRALTSRRAWTGRWVLALTGVALIAASCGSSDPTPTPDPVAAVETTTTTTTTSVTREGTEDPAADPAGLTFDEYLVAVINANADAGECGEQAEIDFNAAQPADYEPTEADVEGGKEYFAGQFGCKQIADDAIAALQPPPEAAAAHADLVAARHVHLTASRAEMEAAETMDEITRAFVEPGPAVIEAYGNWSTACGALQDVATSNGIDADLECPFLNVDAVDMPPPGSPVTTATG